MHSSVCDIDRTLEQLATEGLETEILVRHRGPLGPLLRERAPELWAAGTLPHGSLEEEMVILRGRRPLARAGGELTPAFI